MIVPLFPSHFSALGMLAADERHDFIRTYYSDLATVDFAALVKVYEEMHEEAGKSLRNRRNAKEQIQLDIRYTGQDFTLSMPVTLKQLRSGNRKGVRQASDRLYQHRYAHSSPEDAAEVVEHAPWSDRQAPDAEIPPPRQRPRQRERRIYREVYFWDSPKPVRCPVYRREALTAGTRIAGPALVQEHGTTTVLYRKDVCTVAPWAN